MTPQQLEYLSARVAFAYPVRPWSKTKVDAFFLDPTYLAAFGQNHRGIDINGVGGGDTDLGLPVQSLFPGMVVGVSTATGWGWTVLVRAEPWVAEVAEHLLGVPVPVLETQHTHLHQVTVKIGDRVNAGDHLGSIGKGDRGQFLAHLHLEVRRASFPATHPQRAGDEDADWIRENCLDPLVVLRQLPFTDFGATLPPRVGAAPADLLEHNGQPIDGERVVSVNRDGMKTFVYDQRPVPPEGEAAVPKNLLEAILYGLRLYWSHR